jgi:ADP-ribosylglycohydrolase
MKNVYHLLPCLALFFCACTKNKTETGTAFPSPDGPPPPTKDMVWDTALTREILHDKMLGMLVGAAIGDAMGAPTEMWHRSYIPVEWDHVDTLGPVIREGSAEGTWEDNLPSGSTTDDTRWKYLIGSFLAQKPFHRDSLDTKAFGQYIIDIYLSELDQLKKVDAFKPEPFEKEVMHAAWLQEWAVVAQPYTEGKTDAYVYALNKFYGGEMTCAGMLYTPVIGAYYPGNPEKAYTEAYRLGLFDLGYARDLSALTAALVSEAMRGGAKAADLARVTVSVDPFRYFNSRLSGRVAFRLFRDAKTIAYEANKIEEKDLRNAPPIRLKNWKRDRLYYARVQKAYALLDEKLQDTPFHAAEIHLINLTALEFSQGDFQEALEFVVNYGRDNDTVAAITGAVLGAYWGAKKLPQALVKKSLAVNKKVLGMDLKTLAEQMAHACYRGI